jgi:hypothetical protein
VKSDRIHNSQPASQPASQPVSQSARQPARGTDKEKETDRSKGRQQVKDRERQRAVDEMIRTPCDENLLHAVMNSLMGCTDCFLRHRRIYRIIPYEGSRIIPYHTIRR